MTAPAAAALDALYAELTKELARIKPSCQLSGRCCRFAEYGHSLFVTTLELERLTTLHGPPPEMIGESCPYQTADGGCGAREGRPLGCRVYFCDPTYEAQMPELTERYHARLQQIHRQHDVPYRYGEFLAGLRSWPADPAHAAGPPDRSE